MVWLIDRWIDGGRERGAIDRWWWVRPRSLVWLLCGAVLWWLLRERARERESGAKHHRCSLSLFRSLRHVRETAKLRINLCRHVVCVCCGLLVDVEPRVPTSTTHAGFVAATTTTNTSTTLRSSASHLD